MKLLKFEITGLDIFDKKTPITIDFINEKRVNESEIEDGTVYKLADKMYQLNTLALVGINASGKTTMLKVISNIIEIYMLNHSISLDMALLKHLDESLSISVYMQDKKHLYRIDSVLSKEFGRVIFSNEKIYQKPINIKSTRNELFNFDVNTLIDERLKTNNSYLKDVDSIFSAVLNKKRIPTDTLQNLLYITNENRVENFPSGTPISFVKFLDPSIKKLNAIENMYELQFECDNTSKLVSEVELNGLLSSGTIKGINMLIAMQKAFNTGGYLLIDELENHFNKTIVINLLALFLSKTNTNGATLIFSTHYSEILDSISRSDSIYILRKAHAITVDKYSTLAQDKDRTDKKKSALILSGKITSAPKYQDLMQVKSEFAQLLGDTK